MNPPALLLAAALVPAIASAQPPRYRDPALPVDQRVEDLLRRMTLEEKVAQLQTYRSDDPTAWNAQGNFVGGKDAVFLAHGAGAYFNTGGQPLEKLFSLPPKVWAERINSEQRYVSEHSRLGVPLFVFGEALHGFMAADATSFPQAIALGSTWDPALVEQVFAAVAQEASARGTHQVLAPVLDLARDPRWGRTEECYSEDPYLVAAMGRAAIFGLQGRGPVIDREHVAVTLKHFAGHGQPEGGRNIAPVDFGEREFRETHLYPFQVAVEQAHAQAVMASYNEWDGVPNHVNHHLLTDILRGEWGFQGFVMSDGSGLDVLVENHHVAATLADAGLLALNAGLDYDLHSQGAFLRLADEVRAGRIAENVVNRAARNVLRVKFTSGLFDHPYADLDAMARVTNSPAHRGLALQAAQEAIILLKNDRHVLPFDAARIKTLAVIGPNAAGIHLGDYSPVPMRGVSVLAGIRGFAGKTIDVRYAEGCQLTVNKEVDWRVNQNPVLGNPAVDRKLIAEAVAVAKQSDAVVLVLGANELLSREAWGENHLGDRDSLDLIGRQNELAAAILATGKPVAVVLINGAPLSINYLAQHAPAILECWYLGQATGIAVTNVLFGDTNPSGKLTVTIPRSVGQLPCYYDHKPSRFRDYLLANSTPLYPFGFGLSYTTFAYKNLKVTPTVIPPDGRSEVTVDVTNTGARRGDEIVELYLHKLVSLPTRPVLELKDFARVALEAGETRTVTFALTPDKLAALGMDLRPVVQPGVFEVLVGGSSVSLQKAELTVSAQGGL